MEVHRSRKGRMDAKLLLVAGILASLRQHQVEAQSPERRYACWGSFGPPVVSAQCPRNTVIQVIRAGLKVQNHVGLCAYNDNDCGCEYGQRGCQMQDVRTLCMGRPACRLDVTQQYINTATCRGFSDYMYIEFNCVPVELNSVSDVCTSVKLKSESGFLRSPNSHINPGAARECECSLTTETDSNIELTVLDFQSQDYTCDHNKLQVSYNGQSTHYCNQQTDKINSNTNAVHVKFDTDGQGGKSSFWLKYEATPPNPVKLMCTHRIVETTTDPQTTTQRLTTKPRKPKKTFKPRKRKEKIEKIMKANEVQDTEKTDLSSSTSDKYTTPWWWRFTEKPNATKYYRDNPTNPPTKDKTMLSDLPRSRRYHTMSIPRHSSSSTSTTTTTENRYQHPKPAHPEAIAGKSSPYFNPNILQHGNFDFSKTDPKTFSLNPTNSERLWSHLPSSLLKKLQFPLPLIRALEKELVVEPEKQSDRYLRVLPALQPNKNINRYKHLGHNSEGTPNEHPNLRTSNSQPAEVDSMPSKKLDTKMKTDIQGSNSSGNPSDINSEDMFQSYGRSDNEWRVTNSPLRPHPRYSTKKTKFTNMNQASDQLGIKRKRKKYQRFISKNKRKRLNNDRRPYTGEEQSPDPPVVVKKKKGDFTDKVKKIVKILENTKIKRGQKHQEKTTVSPPLNTTTSTTTPQPTTAKPQSKTTDPPLAKHGKSNNKRTKGKKLKVKYPKTKGKSENPSIRVRGNRRDKFRNVKAKEDNYKVPTSKVALQPVTWIEPMDMPEKDLIKNRVYPREKYTYSPRRRYPVRSRPKYRYSRNYEFESSIDDDMKRYKRKRPKNWQGRTERPRFVSPKPKMYLPAIGPRKKEENVVSTIKTVYVSPFDMTTQSSSITTSKTEPTLVDSVHKDRYNVVEELAGKIQSVSDFYKTLDEEDWTSWPAFEKVKNSPDFNGPILAIASSSDVRPRDVAHVKEGLTMPPNPPIPTPRPKPKTTVRPKPRPKVAKVTAPSLTGTSGSIDTTHYSTMADPTYAPPTLDNSIPQMPRATKMASASPMAIPAEKVRRRTPGKPITRSETPNQTESLQGQQNNLVTIIVACVVGSILLLIILGIVIRFIMRRNHDREEGIHFASAKGLSRNLSATNFDGRKIPRPKRV